jgi:hypothetical protein
MTKFFYFTMLTGPLWSCDQPTTLYNNKQQLVATRVTEAKISQSESFINPGNLFTLSDAEKILGEQAHLKDSSSTIKGDTFTYLCAYCADAKDLKSGKTGCIYFLVEQYAQLSSAREKYSFIKTANEDHGIKVLYDIGDEAYFHTDSQNFYFIMVRKGTIVFNMKVNKITSNTSLDEFNRIAKKITDAL